jgi:hypothetical protein
MPGQVADNAFLTSNEQIFAWTDQPTLSGFLAQGPATILTNVGMALWHNAFDVLLVPGNIIVVSALLTIVLGWRMRSAVSGSPLWALLVHGAITFLITSIVFPVATQWGTFEHASGPLLLAFAVVAVLGADSFVARVRQWRNWPRPNAGMAPAALTAVVVAMSVLALLFAGAQAQARQRQLAAVVAAVNATPGFPTDGSTIASDLPIWLSDALGRPVAVLPAEPAAQLGAYLAQFKPSAIVLVDNLRASADTVRSLGCATEVTPAANADAPELTIFVNTRSCP